MKMGKGTRRELLLAVSRLKMARAHIGAARCGLKGEKDAEARWCLVQLHLEIERLRNYVLTDKRSK